MFLGFCYYAEFHKRTKEQIQKKLGNRCTDRWTYGHTEKYVFIELHMPGVQKTHTQNNGHNNVDVIQKKSSIQQRLK